MDILCKHESFVCMKVWNGNFPILDTPFPLFGELLPDLVWSQLYLPSCQSRCPNKKSFACTPRSNLISIVPWLMNLLQWHWWLDPLHRGGGGKHDWDSYNSTAHLIPEEGKGLRGPSATQFSCKSQELEIHIEKHFKGSHKKESHKIEI
jgi:hypothetical protein